MKAGITVKGLSCLQTCCIHASCHENVTDIGVHTKRNLLWQLEYEVKEYSTSKMKVF